MEQRELSRHPSSIDMLLTDEELQLQVWRTEYRKEFSSYRDLREPLRMVDCVDVYLAGERLRRITFHRQNEAYERLEKEEEVKQWHRYIPFTFIVQACAAPFVAAPLTAAVVSGMGGILNEGDTIGMSAIAIMALTLPALYILPEAMRRFVSDGNALQEFKRYQFFGRSMGPGRYIKE